MVRAAVRKGERERKKRREAAVASRRHTEGVQGTTVGGIVRTVLEGLTLGQQKRMG